MNSYNTPTHKNIINIKSEGIIINQCSPTNKSLKKEYSLKQNVFDPTKGSPPNNFMNNLRRRMDSYNTYTIKAGNDIIE